jgi:hypothetical protein
MSRGTIPTNSRNGDTMKISKKSAKNTTRKPRQVKEPTPTLPVNCPHCQELHDKAAWRKQAQDYYDTIKSNQIDEIALQLDEDVYGGGMDDQQIRDHLMKTIVAQYHGVIPGTTDAMSVAVHEYRPVLSLTQVADIIMGVWNHKDRECVVALKRSVARKKVIAA